MRINQNLQTKKANTRMQNGWLEKVGNSKSSIHVGKKVDLEENSVSIAKEIYKECWGPLSSL